MTSLKETLLARLAQARAVLENMKPQKEVATDVIDWQKGYVKALEEVLDDLEGVPQRRYPRRATDIPTEIVRPRLERGAPGPSGQGMIMDLSLGGCRLYTTAMELSEGEIIELTIRLPGNSTTITLQGSVRRISRYNRALGAGVEFINLSEDVAAELQALLAPPPPAEDG